ncbi:pyridoxamine 5'-phosphate oxidase family protein [Streptomyces sp. NPDC007083]|uniref:pyridoxamine 5'-phosphate oxidase family protein n=1 Tax=unclassified Streptomyces TaxID=2593676 RepID=UPI0033DABDF1
MTTTHTPAEAPSGPDTSWAGFEQAEPGLASTVRRRFGQYRHHVLATLRADGSPRLTGLEADFRAGELWPGMMPNSRKALDLRRDPRFALFANPGSGTGMGGGDVRVSGRAEEVTEPAGLARWAAGAPDGELPDVFHLFRAVVAEVVHVTIEGEEMVLRTWHPGRRSRTVRRGNDDAPPQSDPAG